VVIAGNHRTSKIVRSDHPHAALDGVALGLWENNLLVVDVDERSVANILALIVAPQDRVSLALAHGERDPIKRWEREDDARSTSARRSVKRRSWNDPILRDPIPSRIPGGAAVIRARPSSAGGRNVRALFASCATAVMWMIAAERAQALDIDGVLPTSIGLPEANVVLRPVAAAGPYSGLDSFGFPLTNLRMIYDTGASGVIVFEGPAQALGLPGAQFLGGDVVFTDVGVGGSTTFKVFDAIHMSLGNCVQDPPNPYTVDDDYPRQSADLRLQIGPPGSAALFVADFTQLGIAAMPAMAGRVSVINPKLAEVSFSEVTPADTIHTYGYDFAVPPESGPGILTPDLHVELFMKSFDRFTQTRHRAPPGRR
jgi:hypothetical protein